MTRAQMLRLLKREIQELMGTLSVEEIIINRPLIRQIEVVLGELAKAA